MYTAKIENRSGDVYILNGDEAVWQVASITGLNPPQGLINTTTIVGLDGALYNSAKLETRNIVITVRITGKAERNRQLLYRAFRTKEWCRFYYSNDSVDVWIDGYVESVECDLFQKAEQAQISIICPQPYFRSVKQMIADISSTTALFTFPFTINESNPIPISSYEADATAVVTNETATPTGVIIEMDFQDSASEVVLANTDTGETITLNYAFQAADRVTINTNPGEKSVRLTRGGVTTSIFSAVALGSVFFQLAAGRNAFTYSVDQGEKTSDVYVIMRFYIQYRGV